MMNAEKACKAKQSECNNCRKLWRDEADGMAYRADGINEEAATALAKVLLATRC